MKICANCGRQGHIACGKTMSIRELMEKHGFDLGTEEEQQDRIDMISPTRYEDE